jgi:hypothetical protein
VIVSCIDAPDEPFEAPEPDEPSPEPDEPPPGGTGPIALIVPGVVAPEGSTMDTASPVVTGGRSGPSATVTVRLAAVTA